MRKFSLLLIATLLLAGMASCDKNDDHTGTSDFEVPELTLLNTIQFTVDIKSNYSVDVHLSGREMAVDWGDGKVSKAEDQRTGDYIDLHIMSHVYKSTGKYRVKIWTENLTKISLCGLLREFSDVHVGSCPMLKKAVFNSFANDRSVNFNGCLQLETLELSNCALLESAIFNECSELKELVLYTNPIMTPLDLRNHANLSSLFYQDCAIDIQKLPKNIVNLTCIRSGLEAVNLEDYMDMTAFNCSNNEQLVTINISGCDRLSELDFSNTSVTSFNFSECPALTTVDCSRAGLTTIDITHNPYLRSFDCSHNKLSTLDVSVNANMHILYLNDNLFDKDALETIFTALPSCEQRLTVQGASVVHIANNPGSAICNKLIATDKYWFVRD